MKLIILHCVMGTILLSGCVATETHTTDNGPVSDHKIAEQRAMLAANTRGKGFGPQSPRDIDMPYGKNTVLFSASPTSKEMNLCNIHFHKGAEHKGGEFTKYAGNGNGEGYQSGYLYAGKLSPAQLKPVAHSVCPSPHGDLVSGDTIEVHYVYSSAQVAPGYSLKSCLNDSIANPQLRVEAQVYVLVNDQKALDFKSLVNYKKVGNFYQAVNIPSNTGKVIQYAGSTTGPDYNEKGSPFQVSWGVRPKVALVNIETVGKWCDEDNVFKEDHAHGVRNLVINPDLLSNM